MKTNEINVVELVNKVLQHKKSMAVCIAVSLLLGIGFALGQQKQYTSYVTIAPEMNSMGMSQSLGDLAGAIGMDLGNMGSNPDAIYPEIYPNIFASQDFAVKLFGVSVNVKGVKKSYYDHILKDKKTPFYAAPFKYVKKWFAKPEEGPKGFKNLNPFALTREQDNVCRAIIANIDCQMDKGTSIINISATDWDPYVAACIADTLQRRLQDYITKYRTQKARQDYANAVKLNREAKAKYEKKRQQYAAFADANTDVVLKSYEAKLEDMENDLQLKYNNYAATQQQVQKALDKIQERTPAFTIIQRASVPLKASSTPRSVMVLAFLVLGFVIDVAWVLGIKDGIKKIKFS